MNLADLERVGRLQTESASQAINPYSYIHNNPLSGTDPTGYYIEESFDCSVSNCGAVLSGSGVTDSHVEPAENNGKSYENAGNESNGEISDNESQKKVIASESTILEDPNEFIKNLPVLTGDDAIKNDKEVKEAVEKIRNAASVSNEDLEASEADRKFTNRIKRALYKALNKRNKFKIDDEKAELFMSIGVDGKGNYVVLNAGLAPQGGDFSAPKGTEFIVHYHHELLERGPSDGDNSPVKEGNLPNMTITLDRRGKCCSIYEVGRNSGKEVYRRVNSDSSVGPWKEHPAWNK